MDRTRAEVALDGRVHQTVLLDQPFVKNPEKAIKDLLTEKVAKLGENMQIRRFVRFQLGA